MTALLDSTSCNKRPDLYKNDVGCVWQLVFKFVLAYFVSKIFNQAIVEYQKLVTEYIWGRYTS